MGYEEYQLGKTPGSSLLEIQALENILSEPDTPAPEPGFAPPGPPLPPQEDPGDTPPPPPPEPEPEYQEQAQPEGDETKDGSYPPPAPGESSAMEEDAGEVEKLLTSPKLPLMENQVETVESSTQKQREANLIEDILGNKV